MKCPKCGSNLKTEEYSVEVMMEHLVREPYGKSYYFECEAGHEGWMLVLFMKPKEMKVKCGNCGNTTFHHHMDGGELLVDCAKCGEEVR